MICIDSKHIAELEKQYRINLMNSIIGYKPLNLLGTINDDGLTNLCLVSSVFHMGSNPPLLGLVMRPQRPHNDTLRNIQMTGQYTLNNVLPAWYARAHQTSAAYAAGVSEFDACGFSRKYSGKFKAPFVAEATVRIGLELRELLDPGLNGTTIVIGEVIELLIDNGLVGFDGSVDHPAAGTMAGTGLDSYYLPQLSGRLTYAKPGTEPSELVFKK